MDRRLAVVQLVLAGSATVLLVLYAASLFIGEREEIAA